MPRTVSTFLMFQGGAEDAVSLYVSLFAGATIHATERWAPGEPGPEGGFKLARFAIAGHELVAFESPVKHPFGFTPAVSLFVECASEEELLNAYAKLVERGRALMPLGSYGFSKKFGWVDDRFGVSWQLNLA
jgi:predicted 3-demethylubiquinone-9 3-methyltransferase (glyoxalase superfamily)